MPMRLLAISPVLADLSLPQVTTAEYAKAMCHDTSRHDRLANLYRRTRVGQRSSVLLEPGNGSGPVQRFFAPAADVDDRGPTTADRMSRYAREAPRMAERAAADALEQCSRTAADITHLVTVSCTGFEAPGFDVSLIRSLGLRPTVERTHVGFMGCHGALNGLRVARSLVESQADAVVLLCAVELCSLHFQYGADPGHLVANALFADGAAAAICTSTDAPVRPEALEKGQIASERTRPHDAGLDGWTVLANGSCILPDSEDAMTWRIGDHGFVMTLSPAVPELIGRYLRPWLVRWLADVGFSLDEIATWAIHPGGPRIITAVAEALELRDDQLTASSEVLADCGNMSSPTVFFILDRLRRRHTGRPCVALGFGPGLTAEAAVLI